MKVILLILGVCLILSSPAFASGVNIHLNNDDDSGVASNSNGNALPVASLVQLIRIKRGGSITGRIGQTADAAPPDPGKANWVDSEEQEFVANFTVGQGTGNVGGTFDVAFPAATGDHFLRVWEANALQAGAKYQDIYTPASGENVLFPLDVYVQDFETGISAAAPPAPEVNITIPNVVSFDLDSGAFEQTMTATVNLSVGDEVKLASIDGGQYRVQYIKEADWDAGQGWDSADVTSVDGDGPTVSLPNLTPGTEYRVRAFARNHFVGNNPNWSAVENIETPAAPATGGFAPTNVAVAINDDGSVNLSWNLAGADAAVIEKSTDRGKTWATIQQGGSNLQIAAADSALENQDEDVDSVLYRVRAVDGFPSEKIVGKHTFKFVGGDDVVGVNTFALPFAITSPDIDTALDLVNVLDQKATVFGYWDNTNKKFVGAKKITYANGEVDDASAEVLGDINIQRGINYQVSVSDSVNLVVVGEI